MREDDVRLTADERAAFADIERRLIEDRTHWTRRWRFGRRPRGALLWWAALVLGVSLIVVGLVAPNAAVALAGYVTTLVAASSLTRQLDRARVVLRWRGGHGPPAAP